MIEQPLSQAFAPLTSLALTSAVVMGSPGPSTVSVTAVAAAFGWRRALPYCFGLVLGTTAVLAAVASGLFTLLLSVPYAGPVVSAASAIYMLYLAWRIATAPPLGEPATLPTVPGFSAGLLLAIANPKAYLAIAAVFAGTTVFASPAADTGAKLLVLSAMILLIHFCWLVAGASFAGALRDPERSRIANIAFAVALVASVVLPLLDR